MRVKLIKSGVAGQIPCSCGQPQKAGWLMLQPLWLISLCKFFHNYAVYLSIVIKLEVYKVHELSRVYAKYKVVCSKIKQAIYESK